jgi:hypothetical protein
MQPNEYQPGGLPPALGSDQTPPGLLARLGQLFGGGTGGAAAAPVDPYSDTKAILKFVEECKKEALENRWVYERSWWRVILYILSRQWIYYDRKRGQWLDKRMAKWIPRPVTNVVQVALNTIKTVFQAIQLSTTAKPLTSDADAVATAETVDKLESLIAEEHGMKAVMREFDFWFIALGNCVLQTGWNPEANTRIDQWQECTGCHGQYTSAELADLGENPMCPDCGGAEFEGAVDQHGYPVGDTIKGGAGFTDVLSPFEYATPSVYTKLKDSPLIVRLRWRTKKFCLDTYGAEMCKGVVWGKMPQERSLQLLRAIAQQSDIASTPITYGGDEGSSEGVAEYELWHRPTTQYPHGLVARVLGDSSPVLVQREEEGLPGPLPYRTQNGTPLFPFVHGIYEDLGGRMNGRGALDVMLPKQDQLNQLDSMSALCEQRMANPVWLEPKGAEVKSFTGEPGLVVKYNPNVAGGNAKPERIPGANIPNSLFTRREQIKSDIEELVGTYDVLKGNKPSGIEAFSALNLLKELSESRFGPAMMARAEVYREWYKLAIEIERQFGPEERIRAAMRPNRSWTFKKFKKADLTGAVDIVVEDGSQLPKTALGKRAAIEHGKNLGVLNVMDPEQAYEVMREIGISHLAPSLDASMKGALREQTLFAAWVQTIPPPPQPGMPLISDQQRLAAAPQPQQVQVAAPTGPDDQGGGDENGQPAMQTVTQMVPQPAATQQAILFPGNPLKVRPWDKHMVHIVQHDIFCQSDEALMIFQEYPELEELWGLHRQAHLEAAAQEAMQQAMLSAPGAGAGVGAPPPQGAAKALENSNQNSGHGNPHAHQHAAGSGVQSPQATAIM